MKTSKEYTDSEIQAIFSRTFKGQKNFMTPILVKHGQVKDYIYEVSSGRGLRDSKIWGVTFLNLDGTRIDNNDPSCCCHSTKEVEEVIEGI